LGKEEIFSKFNIKDYNNELEKIIEKKAFSEDAKNLLLSMFYKIENAYDDYKKIKSIEKTKKEELEQLLKTIENDCNVIELIKPKIKEETILKDKKFIAIYEEKKIIAYQNEKSIYYGLCNLQQPKYKVKTSLKIIDKVIEKAMNEGLWISKAEIIRDFDGWSWNIERNDIDNYIYNLIYQNFSIILGENKLNKWLNNNGYFGGIEKNIDKKIYKLICKILVQEYVTVESDFKKEIDIKIKKFKEELSNMEDKKIYLENLAEKKKNNTKLIKKIDNLLSNLNELKDEFIKVNKELDDNNKIFSLSDFVEIKQAQRNKLIKEIDEYSQAMKPAVFVEKKEFFKDSIEIFSSIEDLTTQRNFLIDLQKEILKFFSERIGKIETKKEIYDMIYKLRYYKEIYLNEHEKIKDIKELKKYIENVEKKLLTIACNFKVLNIISNTIEENYRIMEEIFNTNMIDLEDIILEFKKKNEKIILNIYEDENLNKCIEYDKFEDLNVKYNKKIKLFI